MVDVTALPVLALACAVVWTVVRLLGRVPARQVAAEALLAGYAGALAYVVFRPVAASAGARSAFASINLVPARTVIEFVGASPAQMVRQLLGNVLMFAPFGFLLPVIDERCRRFGVTVAVALLISAGIELVQLVMLLALASVRSVDVDDVILNVTGACIGYLAWRAALPVAMRNGRGEV